MTLKFAMAGLIALAGVAATAGTASAAMPNGLASSAVQTGSVENVRLVCDIYGRCFNRPGFYYGGPRFYGYGYGRPRFYGGYGPRFYGGGYRRW